VEKAKRDAVRALAGAVLERAKDDWLDDNWHDDVESFLHRCCSWVRCRTPMGWEWLWTIYPCSPDG